MRSEPFERSRSFDLLFRLSGCLWVRFQRTFDYKDLDWTIALSRVLLDSYFVGHSDRWMMLVYLANYRSKRYEIWRSRSDLEREIVLRRDAVELCPPNHQDRFRLLESLADSLSYWFKLRGNIEDLDELIELRRASLSLIRQGHPSHPASLSGLAVSLLTRFKQKGRARDLDESITLFRASLDKSHPDQASTLSNLSVALATRFEQSGNKNDLNASIELQREVVSLRPEEFAYLDNLANSLQHRFEQSGSEEDLEESVTLHRAALTLCPEGHPGWCTNVSNLANSLRLRFERKGDTGDLEESIRLHRSSLALCPEGRPDRSMFFYNLARSLHAGFKQSGNVDDLEESVRLHRAALDLRPEGHPDRPSSFDGLAGTLKARYGQSQNESDLDMSIRLQRSAVALRPENFAYIDNLAISLRTRFEQGGDADDLEESLRLHRSALALCSEGYPNRSSYLRSLASSLRTRYDRRGSVDDLNESIRLYRDALSLQDEKHPDRSSTLEGLASNLQARFQHSGNMDDLDESVELHRTALVHLPEGHPTRPILIGNLAVSFQVRFQQNGNSDDLNESIELHRASLALRSEVLPDQFSSFSNFADALRTRFKHSGSVDDLDESVQLCRTALDLHPDGHPARSWILSNLGVALHLRYEHYGEIRDLEESMKLFLRSLALLPTGCPERSGIMSNAANALHVRFEKHGRVKDFNKSVQLLRRAASHSFSSILVRLSAAHQWASIARARDHGSTLAAYRTTINLLQQALTISPNLPGRHDLLASKQQYQTLGVDAASYAIEKGDLNAAVELLEQGRALLWSQMRGLRTPLPRLSEVEKELADKLTACCRELEILMTSPESRRVGLEIDGVRANGTPRNQHSHDDMLDRVRKLTAEREAIMNDIRGVPGFEDFMQAPLFEELQKVASEGPVIVVNHSQFRCDALIILHRVDEPCICVPLDERWFTDALDLSNDLLAARYGHGVHSLEYDKALRHAMKVLWDRVVSKVIEELRGVGIVEGSRIWWCPTLFLPTLPFHAAGPYEDAFGRSRYLMDDFISSYTPTLRSLITSRSAPSPRADKLLFVGDTSLRATKKELSVIMKHRRIRKCLLDKHASRDSVLKTLRKVEWVHFACHGKLDRKKPFASSFVLPGGELTLLDIASANLPNAEFAFLSACHTAEHTPASALDEALHLAAAIQFCGFRSVVGTMWQLLDRDGPILAEAVYMHLMKDTETVEIRSKRAAAAVREAALYLRSQNDWTDDGKEADIMTERWVNLIHIGA